MMKTFALTLSAALMTGGLAAAAPALAQDRAATLYKHPGCECCEGHAEHLRQNGFAVEVRESRGHHDEVDAIRAQFGLPEGFEGCHPILVDGYLVDGHVSAATIERLLEERPEGVAGITMPGMPMGVPGMPGPRQGPIEVYAFGKGEPTVWAVE